MAASNITLNKDGFPERVNVWIGIDGQAYFRGTIYATDGVFLKGLMSHKFFTH